MQSGCATRFRRTGVAIPRRAALLIGRTLPFGIAAGAVKGAELNTLRQSLAS